MLLREIVISVASGTLLLSRLHRAAPGTLLLSRIVRAFCCIEYKLGLYWLVYQDLVALVNCLGNK